MTAAAIQRYLEHLRVERRVSAHTLTAYGDALARLEKLADDAQRPLHALQSAHIQRFAAQLHGAGLGARSIALTLSGWRGSRSWPTRRNARSRRCRARISSASPRNCTAPAWARARSR